MERCKWDRSTIHDHPARLLYAEAVFRRVFTHTLVLAIIPIMLQDGDANPLDQYEAVEEEVQEEEEEGEDLMENMERWAARSAPLLLLLDSVAHQEDPPFPR